MTTFTISVQQQSTFPQGPNSSVTTRKSTRENWIIRTARE